MKEIICIIFVFCAACASTTTFPILGKKYDVSSALSDFELKKHSEGQLISVSGFLTFGDDKHNIWESEKDYNYIIEKMPLRSDPAWGRCISLSDYGSFRQKLLKYNGKQVTIFGYISRHVPEINEINLGSCNDVSLSLDGDGAQVSIR